jgi:hypothetical protein
MFAPSNSLRVGDHLARRKSCFGQFRGPLLPSCRVTTELDKIGMTRLGAITPVAANLNE